MREKCPTNMQTYYEVTELERDMAKTNRPTESDKKSRNLLLKTDAT